MSKDLLPIDTREAPDAARMRSATPSLLLHACALNWARGQGAEWRESWQAARRCWRRRGLSEH